MAKPEWGTKRFCQNCGARFYDMGRDPVTCPKCGTPFAPRPLVRQRKAATAVAEEASPATAKKGKAVAVDDAETVEDTAPTDVEDDEFDETDEDLDSLTDDEEDDSLMEDASELGEDDDDMSEVMDHVSDPDRGDRS